MGITDVLKAAPAFIALAGAVRAVASIRIRGALRSARGIQHLAKGMAVGLVLMVGPTMEARAAEPAPPLPPDVHQRTAVVDAPDVELKALDDTLHSYQRQVARPNDTSDALMPWDGARSSAEAELDALTAATRAENAAHGATAYAPTWDNGVGGNVPAAEAELHALLAWQDSQNRAGSTPAKSHDREGAMAQSTPPATSH